RNWLQRAGVVPQLDAQRDLHRHGVQATQFPLLLLRVRITVHGESNDLHGGARTGILSLPVPAPSAPSEPSVSRGRSITVALLRLSSCAPHGPPPPHSDPQNRGDFVAEPVKTSVKRRYRAAAIVHAGHRLDFVRAQRAGIPHPVVIAVDLIGIRDART